MPITIEHERDNIYRLDVSGVLKKSDFDRSQDALIAEMSRRGAPVRLLFVLSAFDGWERTPAWGDLTFYVKHGGQIERIAIVAEERWRNQALLFAAAGLRRAPVEFFSQDNLTQARTWLSE